jgi:hypothetical protein
MVDVDVVVVVVAAAAVVAGFGSRVVNATQR